MFPAITTNRDKLSPLVVKTVDSTTESIVSVHDINLAWVIQVLFKNGFGG